MRIKEETRKTKGGAHKPTIFPIYTREPTQGMGHMGKKIDRGIYTPQ
jgi:hypothetical protein